MAISSSSSNISNPSSNNDPTNSLWWGKDMAPPCTLHSIPAVNRSQFEEKIQSDAEQQLQTIVVQQTVPIEARVLWGDPATTICDVARTRPCELIVMSTHGRTGLAHVFIGSVAERVVRYAPCAILIVRAFPARQP